MMAQNKKKVGQLFYEEGVCLNLYLKLQKKLRLLNLKNNEIFILIN